MGMWEKLEHGQDVLLSELREWVMHQEEYQAPGSETNALSLFTSEYGVSGDDDRDKTVSPEDAGWWIDYYEAQDWLLNDVVSIRDKKIIQELLNDMEPEAALRYASEYQYDIFDI